MEQREEWGPWIGHGRMPSSPVPMGTFVQCTVFIREHGVFTEVGVVNHNDWRSVLRYRVRKPRGLVILEERLALVDAPQREGVPA